MIEERTAVMFSSPRVLAGRLRNVEPHVPARLWVTPLGIGVVEQSLSERVLGRFKGVAGEPRPRAPGKDPLPDQPQGACARRFECAVADREIDAFAFEILDLVRRGKAHVNSGMPPLEVIDPRHEPKRRKKYGRRDSETPGRPRPHPTHAIPPHTLHPTL